MSQRRWHGERSGAGGKRSEHERASIKRKQRRECRPYHDRGILSVQGPGDHGPRLSSRPGCRPRSEAVVESKYVLRAPDAHHGTGELRRIHDRGAGRRFGVHREECGVHDPQDGPAGNTSVGNLRNPGTSSTPATTGISRHRPVLGAHLGAAIKTVSEDLARAVVDRISALEKSAPRRKLLQRWPHSDGCRSGSHWRCY